MAKWEVQIFGITPSCLVLEAVSEDAAKAQALECVLDELSFEAELATDDDPCAKKETEKNDQAD